MPDQKQNEELRRLQIATANFKGAFQGLAAVLDEVKARGPQNYTADQFSDFVEPVPADATANPVPGATPGRYGLVQPVTMTGAQFIQLVMAFDLIIAYVQGEQRAHDAPATDYKPIIYACSAVQG